MKLNWNIALLTFLLAGCAPSIQLETPEPIKFDVNMKVDVQNHAAESQSATTDMDEKMTPREGRRYRMAEVQSLKNSKIIGEGNEGLLVMRNKPADDNYGLYAEKIMGEENTDRTQIFTDEQKISKKDIAAVKKEFADRARQAAFKGEWIQNDDGKWVQK
jgi:hypothetical protein